MPEVDFPTWEAFLSTHPATHLLQTAAWGELKAAFGWHPRRVVSGSTGAQVLFRRLPLGLSFGYLPMGPVGDAWVELWPRVDALCRQERAVFLKVEPDCEGPLDPLWVSECLSAFTPSNQTVQPPRSLVISLEGGEEAVLGRMKQKTRYNIRLAERKGVSVHSSTDLDAFNLLMGVTGHRDRFGVHSPAYYRRAYDLFAHSGGCQIFQAEYVGQPLAGVMVFRSGARAWYLYGASADAERERMPAYLAQWAGIRWAIAAGCQSYDLWGVPDAEEAELEDQFEHRGDGLWGVYRFKRGFGGRLVRSAGAWDRIYHPALYRLYNLLLTVRGGLPG